MVVQEALISQGFFVVGIGASAEGLKALKEFFTKISSSSDAAFVVIQHSSNDFNSSIEELLQQYTKMEVHQAKEGMKLKANSVYLISPEQNLIFREDELSLAEITGNNHRLDLFFQSLAQTYRDRSVGVILSDFGINSINTINSTSGLSAINEAGGVAFVQNTINIAECEVEFDGAISTDVAKQILSPRELALLIEQHIISSLKVNILASDRIFTLEYELQQTRANVQTLMTKLESINEEQQASNQELYNEELQSTNKELSSVNEKLQTVSIEYQAKTQELIESNYDVENLLQSTEIGVIFLDLNLKIRKFTPAIKKVISIQDSDLNCPLEELNFLFECADFIPLLQQVIETKQSTELEIKLRDREQYFLMRLNPYYVAANKCEGVVVSFIELNEIKKVQKQLQETLIALTQSEARLYLALSGGDLGTWGWQPKENCLIWDDHLVSLHGISSNRSPYFLEDWLILIHPEDRQKVQTKLLSKMQDRESFKLEYRIIRADDTISYFSTKGKVYVSQEIDYSHIVGVTIDITEIRETERELFRLNQELEQRVAQRTKSLADFSDRIKQLHRLATAEHQQLDSIFTDYLQTGCQMFNLSTGIISKVKDEIYTIVAVQSPLDLTVDYEIPCHHTYCAEVIETQQTITYAQVGTIESMTENTFYLNLKLKSFIGTPIFVNGNLYGTLNFSDTTPRENGFTHEEIEIVELMARDIGQCITSTEAEKALRDSENRFRNTFEKAATGIAHVSCEGRFIRVNQRLCEMIGHESDRLIELTFQDITHPDDLETDLNYFKQMLAGEIANYSMEKRYFRRDGSIIWINLTVSLIRNYQGEPQYFISVIEDISHQKAMAQVLTKLLMVKSFQK
jgi:PAS domain S-box-containing protein